MLELLLEIDLGDDTVRCAEYVIAYTYMLADALGVDALDVWGQV